MASRIAEIPANERPDVAEKDTRYRRMPGNQPHARWPSGACKPKVDLEIGARKNRQSVVGEVAMSRGVNAPRPGCSEASMSRGVDVPRRRCPCLPMRQVSIPCDSEVQRVSATVIDTARACARAARDAHPRLTAQSPHSERGASHGLHRGIAGHRYARGPSAPGGINAPNVAGADCRRQRQGRRKLRRRDCVHALSRRALLGRRVRAGSRDSLRECIRPPRYWP